MATPRALESPDLYNIGWITALPIERAASTAMLDERHDKPRGFVQHPSDTNAYTWGRIGEHNLVIASLPAGQIGTTPAATTASNLLASLPQIRVALLVGIGGGISRPEEGRDIRLGDIVVSQPQGTTGGVVQYDLGKAKLNKEWEQRGFLSAPPPVLLHALAAIQAEYELGESRIAEFLGGTPKLKKGVSGYSHQGFENDRLFKASFDHTGAANCANCNNEEVIERIQRDTTDPEVHYGIIASGNTVVKNALTRDEIVQEVGEDCMCFEMEAAGLMNHFPCLVIRGICDYADSHKNDRWQRYASATAAAYAKDLLGYVPIRGLQETPRALDILRSVRQNIQEIYTIASETKSGIKSLQSDSHHAKLKTWLSPPDVSTNLTDALKCRQQGTCSWLLQSKRYREWRSGKRQHLWLHGIPGCGKTVLSAAIVDDLMQQLQPPDVVLFFYFDFKEIEKQSPNKMVRSLVAQLYSSCVDSRAELEKLFLFCEKGDRQPTETALLSTFLEMSKHAGRLQIVLDALDECSMRGDLLMWLETLSLSDHEGLHLLATSRKEEEIESGLGHWLECTSIILIQSHSINQDIRTYLHETLQSDRGFDRWHRRPEVLNEIEAELMLKADGMFRWVVCQIDSLKHCLDLRKLRQSLRTLPATLQETYARILINIPENYRKEAIRILQFLTYSNRPLTVDEVVDIIVVEPDEDPLFDPTFRMPETREIMRICSSLVSQVTRRRGQSTIEELQLAHFTVQQYLESERVDGALSLMTVAGVMTRICLAYLSQVDEGKSLTAIKEELPLAMYAAESWIDHARYSETRPDVEKSILKFLLHQSQAYAAWGKLFDLDQPWNGPLWWADKKTAPPLYYASLAGLQHTVLGLLGNGAEANADGGAYGNALQAASSVGETHIVRLLLDHGADVNVQGGLYGSPLQAASIKGHKDVVLLLLARGAEICSQGGLYSDALYASAAEGHEEIVRLLIDHGA
ncbi:Pfs, NACHT and ankyrin domain protein, partial [Aspergillus aculeatinus CBS 121060]